MAKTNVIKIPVSPAELLDRIAILEVKKIKLSDGKKIENVKRELWLLKKIKKEHIPTSKKINQFQKELRTLSARGWDIEEGKRACEREKNFGRRFIKFARGAFKNNDERAELKKKINFLLGSQIIEEKSYIE